MNDPITMVETDVDIFLLIKKMLLTWRIWLLLGVLCGGMAMWGMHIKQSKAEMVAMPKTEEEMQATLSKDELVAVENAVDAKKNVDTQKTYLTESMLMNTDLLNEKEIVLTYKIDASSESDCNEKKIILLQQITSDLFMKNISSVYPKQDVKYISEMISIEENLNSASYNPMMTITCVLTKDLDSEMLKQNIIKEMTRIQEETGILLTNTGISKITVVDQTKYATKQQLENTMETEHAALTNTVGTFSAQQQALYQYEIQPSNKKNIAKKATTQTTVGWSKKYFAIGFIGFAFLWFLLLIVKDIWHRPVETVMDALNAEHKKCLGRIARAEKTGRWHRIVYDPFLEKKLSPRKEPIDLQYEKLLENIALNLKAEQKSEMLMVQMGALDTEGSKLIQKLQQDLNDRQLTLTCIEPEALEREWLRRKEQKKETLLVMNLTGKTVSHASYLAIQNMLLTRGRELFGIMAV